MLLDLGIWVELRGADAEAFALFRRHYSFNHRAKRLGPNRLRIAAPGECMVLMTPDGLALFVWSRQKYHRENGVGCAVFRNEGSALSSELILAAEEMAWDKWPGERLFTFVNQRKVQSSNPGYCFLKAGWRKCGVTKKRKLLIFEKGG